MNISANIFYNDGVCLLYYLCQKNIYIEEDGFFYLFNFSFPNNKIITRNFFLSL